MKKPEDLWTRRTDGFPANDDLSTQIRFLLGYAMLAPSGHNTQPWLVRIGTDTVDVLADRTRALPVVDPDDRELAISCGAAIGMLEVAARRFGLTTEVTNPWEADAPDLLARVSFASGYVPTDADLALFDAIQARRTNRTGFDMTALPQGLVDDCQSAVAEVNVEVSVLDAAKDRETVAALVAEGDKLQFDDPAFRKELSHWVRSSSLGAQDGMSGAGFGMPDILSAVGSLVIRTFDLGDSTAASDTKKIKSGSPALMVLGSGGDATGNWVSTGRTLARVLLLLTSRGFAASYLNQPIETASLRPKLRSATGMSGFPQILLRVGQAASVPPTTARRDLDDVILN